MLEVQCTLIRCANSINEDTNTFMLHWSSKPVLGRGGNQWRANALPPLAGPQETWIKRAGGLLTVGPESRGRKGLITILYPLPLITSVFSSHLTQSFSREGHTPAPTCWVWLCDSSCYSLQKDRCMCSSTCQWYKYKNNRLYFCWLQHFARWVILAGTLALHLYCLLSLRQAEADCLGVSARQSSSL